MSRKKQSESSMENQKKKREQALLMWMTDIKDEYILEAEDYKQYHTDKKVPGYLIAGGTLAAAAAIFTAIFFQAGGNHLFEKKPAPVAWQTLGTKEMESESESESSAEEMESESEPESSAEKMTSDFVETSSSEIPKVAVKLNSEQQHSGQQTSRAQESSSTVSQQQSQESNVPSQAKTEPKVTESAAEESVAPVSTADLTSVDSSTTSVSQESTTSTEWYQVTGEVVEGDGDAKGIAVEAKTPEYFMISFYGSANDDVSISNVRIAVWTEANGQDDIEWINAEARFGISTGTYTIYAKNHNNETSGYIVHVYYTDSDGVEKVYYNPETISISQ